MRASLSLCACWLIACEPQQVHLSTTLRAPLDSGAPSNLEPTPDTGVAPPTAGQPECRSPDCVSCAAEPSACLVSEAQWLCHPWTGICALPCAPESSSSECPREQRCHPDYGLCVDCVADDECSGATPACDPQRNVCVQCVVTTDCANLSGDDDPSVCDPINHVCVECLSNDDCNEPDKPFCKLSELECDDDLDD